MSQKITITLEEALDFHAGDRPGKIEIQPIKPLITQRDLALAYSPGVAHPCLAIQESPDNVYNYTSRGNMVAVISNGTAVLGLGALGALACKPVMEGKATLFKRFADIDSIDIEVNTDNVEEFIGCVRYLGPSFGGINLEDIRAPDCFIIEKRLQEILDIPVFHDDQHGTAIIAAAGLINALDITGRDLASTRMVICGAGAAGLACAGLIKAMGMPHDAVLLYDAKGVVRRGHVPDSNPWKEEHAIETKMTTLAEAIHGADVFFGLSVKDVLTQEMVASMAPNPIIFAMANPDPEISPELARDVRPDAIIATGRSDYPNQVNNVLGFPYIFRGALDVRARMITTSMKIAAARALAKLAREDVPDEVARAYSGRRMQYGPHYVIPSPFDPRLNAVVASAVAEAAMHDKVARYQIRDMEGYRAQLRARLDPTMANLQAIFEHIKACRRRIVFAEGEEESVIRAALAFQRAGYGYPILVGREEPIRNTFISLGLSQCEEIEIVNARLSKRNSEYTASLYAQLQRQGYLERDCQRLVNQDRNVFAACMVAYGDADAMVTGLTRSYVATLEDIKRVLEPPAHSCLFGLSIVRARKHTVFIADTAVHERPDPDQLADITIQAASKVRQLGHEPRVALVSYSTFGNPTRERLKRLRQAVDKLDSLQLSFEYDGEMGIDVALDDELRRVRYPFCRLSGSANILIMPALDTANIATKLLRQLGGATVIGPLLIGLAKPVQIVNPGSDVAELVNTAAFACHEALLNEKP